MTRRWAPQTRYTLWRNIAGSPPLQHFFEWSCVARAPWRVGWAPPTRYTLRRNTASIMKDLIWFENNVLSTISQMICEIVTVRCFTFFNFLFFNFCIFLLICDKYFCWFVCDKSAKKMQYLKKQKIKKSKTMYSQQFHKSAKNCSLCYLKKVK